MHIFRNSVANLFEDEDMNTGMNDLPSCCTLETSTHTGLSLIFRLHVPTVMKWEPRLSEWQPTIRGYQ